jgi:group I intron endonuclease
LLENSTSLIGRALLKYGYSGFSLYILEYCESDLLLNREQYYIDLLNPEYNILRTAGSSLGYKHSIETKAKFKTRKYTSEYLAKLREHLNKHNASDEQRAKARVRMLKINQEKGMGTEVFDTVTGLTTTYSSIRQAADAIGCNHKTIRLSIKAFGNKGIETLIKKRYKVTKIA